MLADDGIITNNGKTYLKGSIDPVKLFLYLMICTAEMILRRDPRLAPLLNKFEEKDDADNTFVEQIHDIISKAYIFTIFF